VHNCVLSIAAFFSTDWIYIYFTLVTADKESAKGNINKIFSMSKRMISLMIQMGTTVYSYVNTTSNLDGLVYYISIVSLLLTCIMASFEGGSAVQN
jgi:hypothetical protein